MANAWKKPLTGVLIGSVTTVVFVLVASLTSPWLHDIAVAQMWKQGYVDICASLMGCQPDPGWGPLIGAAIIGLVIAAIAGFLLLLILRYLQKQALKICGAGLAISSVIFVLVVLLSQSIDSEIGSVVGLLALALAYWAPVMRFGDTAPVKK